jgi:transcriptional regulator with XRE-family HTH domain
LSLRGLAARSGYSTSYLSRVETGQRSATPAVVRLYTTLDPARTGPAVTAAAPKAPVRRPEAGPGPEVGVIWFGSEVRRLRVAAAKSLDELGGEIFLSRSYLGKIEQGDARGSYQLALSLDTALAAQGSLTRLFLEECAHVGPVAPDTDILDHDGSKTAAARGPDPAEHAAAAASHLEILRVRSHQAGPHAIVSELSDAVVELYRLVGGAGRGAANPVWPVLLRYAELLGWTAQETGHDAIALRWTRVVAHWAREREDADGLGYALIRQSQLARRHGDAVTATELVHRAGAVPGLSARIARFAAQREAQAWALAKDEPGFRRALDQYRVLGAWVCNGQAAW